MLGLGGSVLSASLPIILEKTEVLEFFTKNKFDEAIFDDLKTLVLSVKAVLLGDEEQRQFVDPFVKNWVDELREAVYDADDVLDQIDMAKVTGSVFPSLGEGMKSKLLKVYGRLKSLVEHKNLLLKQGGVKTTFLSMPTTCLINELEVYGREGDRDSILNKLFPVRTTCSVDVIAIVGMAGMGKTTLSQIVYNHPRVKSHFQVRSWIHISDGSNVFEVTKKIYDSLTRSNSEIRDLNTLQMKLACELNRKRFLLVLDDYWAEDFLDWELLKRPLESGDHGSFIIVTTRNQSVASTMHVADPHLLPPLSKEDCWKLFSHHAFRTRNPPEATPTLKGIGEKIVSRCKGHPLSVKTLGNLLAFKKEAKDWNNILQSKVWWDLPAHQSNILPALMLSYRHLPGHLKQCFAYCSIFPKGHEFSKRDLVHLWMAEGLLLPSKNGQTMEEVGEEYFHELLSRSFLQQPKDSPLTMHDLMIDLAQHIGGEFFHRMESNDPKPHGQKVRHLSFLSNEFDGLEDFASIFDLSHLRTFLPLSNSGRSHSIGGFLTLLLSQGKSLRVLSLSNYSINLLSNISFEYLMHLRYLNLSNTSLNRLPDSVECLYNLQTLLLSSCTQLVELPKNLNKLTKLQHLDTSGSDILTKMPPEFGKLEELQLLTTFVVSKEGSKISELGTLSKLHDALSIVNLQEIVDPTHASEAKLKEKKFLHELKLKWTDGIHHIETEAMVLQNLVPHTNLKDLKIEHYGGQLFPGWLGHSSFCNMVSVYLVSCKSCAVLPSLGQLPYLETLHIENMTGLQAVDSTFFGNQDTPFSFLKNLTFVNMSAWEKWEPHESRVFPSLQVFRIHGCPGLCGSLPNAPVLQKLELIGCSSLVSLPEKMMQDKTSLTISGCPQLVPLCERGTGIFWPLISGLLRLEIDEVAISLDTKEQ